MRIGFFIDRKDDSQDRIVKLVRENAELTRALQDVTMMAEEAKKGFIHKCVKNDTTAGSHALGALGDIFYDKEVRSVIRNQFKVFKKE